MPRMAGPVSASTSITPGGAADESWAAGSSITRGQWCVGWPPAGLPTRDLFCSNLGVPVPALEQAAKARSDLRDLPGFGVQCLACRTADRQVHVHHAGGTD